MENSSLGDLIFNELFLDGAELGEEDLDEPAWLVDCSVKPVRLERGNIKDPEETKPAVQAWKPRFKM